MKPKLPPYLEDEDVIKLLHTRSPFRRNGVDLMTDQEFLDELAKIIPKTEHNRKQVWPRVVIAKNGALIYHLRWRYENRESTTKAQPKFSVWTLRDQVRLHRITPMTKEQKQAMFGVDYPKINWFSLSDILSIGLGRWGDIVTSDEADGEASWPLAGIQRRSLTVPELSLMLAMDESDVVTLFQQEGEVLPSHISAPEIAVKLGVSESTVRRWVRQGAQVRINTDGKAALISSS